MATRISNPAIQHFDIATAAPLSGGKLFFFEPNGSTTPKDTFTSVDATIANTNPVILDANGFEPDIFGEGSYRIVLQSATDVQQWVRDPVDFESQTGAFSDWLATVTYSLNDIVLGSDGNFYVSIQNNNNNNDPVSSPTFWTLFYLYKRWNPNETYPVGEIVLSLEGKTYEALVSSLNVDPDTDTSNGSWKQFDNLRISDEQLFSAVTNTNFIDFGTPYLINASVDMDIISSASIDMLGTLLNITSTTGAISVDANLDLNLTSSTADIVLNGDAITAQAATGLLTLSSTSGNFALDGAAGTVTANTGDLSLVSTAGAFLLNGESGTISSDTTTIAITSATNTTITAVDIELNSSGNLTNNSEIVGLAEVTTQVFTATGAGVWNRPANVKYIQAEGCGGGGGGGSSTTTAGALAGQGGGAGGYFRLFLDVQATASVNFTIGAGGVGGTVTNGGNGGATTFDVASGGGGFGGQGGLTLPSANGGTATGGDLNIDGGDGDTGVRATTPTGGNGGCSFFGGGGRASLGNNPGNPGRAFGSGGSGSSDAGTTAQVGGDGADGVLIVTEYR